MRRIDTLRNMKRRLARLNKSLAADLRRYSLTEDALDNLAERLGELAGYRGLRARTKELEDQCAAWGDGWSKDDWPHARLRGCPRSGHVTSMRH